MRFAKWMMWACVTTGLWTQPLAGEEPAGQPEPLGVRVVKLAHADAKDVARAVAELVFSVNIAVAQDNTLILRGTAKNIQDVLDQVVTRIDVPSVGGGGGRSLVEYIPLTNRATPALHQLLETVAPWNVGTHYALDPASQLLVVNAPPDQVAAIRGLVKALDRPAEPLSLQFYFLRGKVGAATSSEPAGMPKELAGVVRSLQAAGFGELSLIAPVLVNVNDGARFESNSSLGYGGGAGELRITVEGTADLAADASAAELHLKVEVNGRYHDQSAKEQETRFRTDTTLSAKVDSYVVLAAAPGSTSQGDAIALALRVHREAAPAKP